jgi:hypothetical protein
MGFLPGINIFKPEVGDEKFAGIDLLAGCCRSIAKAAFKAGVTQLRLYRPEFHHHAVKLMLAIRAVAPVADRRAA